MWDLYALVITSLLTSFGYEKPGYITSPVPEIWLLLSNIWQTEYVMQADELQIGWHTGSYGVKKEIKNNSSCSIRIKAAMNFWLHAWLTFYATETKLHFFFVPCLWHADHIIFTN